MQIKVLLGLCILILCSGCVNSECRKVQELEAPAHLALLESAKDLAYWEGREKLDKAGMNVCSDVLKPNATTFEKENWTEVCEWKTGLISGEVLRGLENAQARNISRFKEWSQIVKLYPDCFDPDKVIKANS